MKSSSEVRILARRALLLPAFRFFVCFVSFVVLSALNPFSSSAQTQDFSITDFEISPQSNISLSYDSVTSCYYRVLSSETLTGITSIVDMELGVDGSRQWQSPDPPTNSQSYYRIRRIPISSPLDGDSDVMDDVYELRRDHFLDPLDAADAPLDYDGDRMQNVDESQIGCIPDVPDTDGDLIWDGREQPILLSPTASNVLTNAICYLSPSVTSGVSVLGYTPPGGDWGSDSYATVTGEVVEAVRFTGPASYRIYDPTASPWNNTNEFWLFFDGAYEGTNWTLSIDLGTAFGQRFLVYNPGSDHPYGQKDGLNLKFPLDLDESQFTGAGGVRNKTWRRFDWEVFLREPGNTPTNVICAYLELGAAVELYITNSVLSRVLRA